MTQNPKSYDPGKFSSIDQYLIGEGTHKQLWRVLGANTKIHQGTEGVHFAVWAPNAKLVSVVGDFNDWDGGRNSMCPTGGTGVWEIFVPDLHEGALYKFRGHRC